MIIAHLLLAIMGTVLALGHFDVEYRFRFDYYAAFGARWHNPPAFLHLLLPGVGAAASILSAWLAIWWPPMLSFFGAFILADREFSHLKPFLITCDKSPGHRDGATQLVIGLAALSLAAFEGAINPWLIMAGASGPIMLPGVLCRLRRWF